MRECPSAQDAERAGSPAQDAEHAGLSAQAPRGETGRASQRETGPAQASEGTPLAQPTTTVARPEATMANSTNPATTNKPIVRLEHASKSFGDNHVLRDISLEVTPGEVVAVIGPSGGGKSTLLRCMTLLEQLDDGELWYGDLRVAGHGGSAVGGRFAYADKAVLAKARQRFGLVFQQFNLFPHFTVLRNVLDAPVAVQKRPKAEAEATARELIAKMGLAGNEDKVPCELSGGQQQRASIARALALSPDILYFDEPTSALDPKLTGEVLKVMRQLADEGTTMVVVTHEMSFARDVASRVVFIDGGRIVEEGPSDQVIGAPHEARTREFLTRYSG